MRVLVHEYLSCGAASLPSLAREGFAMLSAVLADLSRCPGIETTALASPPLIEPLRTAAPTVVILPLGQETEEVAFRDAARRCEAALVIAPEFDDLLAHRAEWALEEGCRLLGPSVQAIRQTADKLSLGRTWQAHGVPTPAAAVWAPGPCPFAFPVIVKPRHGAGAVASYLVTSPAEYATAPVRARRDGCSDELIVQPYHGEEIAASVAFLIGPAGRVPLLPCRQIIDTTGGQLHYAGGEVPLEEAWGNAALDIAHRALDVVPGLQGFVGVDVLVAPPGGERPSLAVEINPRLTTSYVGLRRLARTNLMQTLLDVLAGLPTGPVAFTRDGPLRFLPDGSCP